MKNLILVLSIICSLSLCAQPGHQETTGAPYFLIKAENGTKEVKMPLESVVANVNIAGIIADVQIKQVYKNTGNTPIEAIYIFPGSSNSAIYNMEMIIGDRHIKGLVHEKKKARTTYENAKTQGKRTALLEQHRPNVFQMNVANIMPGDQIEVLLSYTELLTPEKRTYQFVLPTVVGPRYNETTEHSFTYMPYTRTAVPPLFSYDIEVYLNGGMAIRELSSPSHDIVTTRKRVDRAQVNLAKKLKTNGNRDFILNYSFAGDQIETGLLVFEDEEESYFLCMAQPPKRFNQASLPPREYIFVMDISGSMTGYPLEVSKELLANLVSELRPIDQFNIQFFAGGSTLWKQESQMASKENINEALFFLNNIKSGGGTELLNALHTTLAIPRCQTDVSRSIIVITDGYVTVEKEAYELIRNNLKNANLFAFGIGTSINRHLIKLLAHAGQGVPFIVNERRKAADEAKKLKEYIQYPLMSNIEASFKGLKAHSIEPPSIPDVLSDRPVIFFGKFDGRSSGVIRVSGFAPQKPRRNIFGTQLLDTKRVSFEFDMKDANKDARNSALKYLWARERIKNLVDFSGPKISPEEIEEVTRLGLKYNLLTPYTSFVAVDDIVANEKKEVNKTIKQVLPLPENVSSSAVGFNLSISGISGMELIEKKNMKIPIIAIAIIFLMAFFMALTSKKIRKKVFQMTSICVVFISFSSCNNVELPRSKFQPYESVSFIVGKDRSDKNPYFRNAGHYYKSDSLEKTAIIVHSCSTMVDVFHWLEENAPQNKSWKEVNIIAHGNEWTGINMPLIAFGPRCDKKYIKHAMDQGVLTPISNDIVNDSTKISIVGCNIGRDKELLKLLSTAFGGTDQQRPMVNSARHFNVFENNHGIINRSLAKSYFIAFPAGSFPGNESLAEAFAKKYPSKSINWKKALLTLKPTKEKEPYVHYFNIPANWSRIYPKDTTVPTLLSQQDIRAWINTEQGLTKQLQEMDLKPSQFKWSTRDSSFQDFPMITVEGQTIIYCVLQPLSIDTQEVENTALYAFAR